MKSISKKLDIVLLAAGNSMRFGSNKLLYLIQGKPMYQYIIDLVLELPKHKINRIILVTQYEEIENAVCGMPVKVVRNRQSDLGISHSLILGLNEIQKQKEDDAGGCLFAVCDQPYLTGNTLEKLIDSFEKNLGGICVVSCKGKIGNPVIFHRKYFKELMELRGDKGGKQIFKNHIDDVFQVEAEQKELEDIDYLVQYSGFFKFLEQKKGIVSIVGAGGKSILMEELGERLAQSGKKVILTTTTHIWKPEGIHYETIQELKKALETEKKVTAGIADSNGKLTGLKEDDKYEMNNHADWIIAEADGAKGMSLKVPAEHEPVLFPGTQIVIGVAGLDAIGLTMKQGCFRYKQACELLGVTPEHVITSDDVADILADENGMKKNIGQHMKYYVALNKADDEQRIMLGRQVQEKLIRLGIMENTLLSRGKEMMI